jgi:hypothetical protein
LSLSGGSLEELYSGPTVVAATPVVSEEQHWEVIVSTPDHARKPCPYRILKGSGRFASKPFARYPFLFLIFRSFILQRSLPRDDNWSDLCQS